MGEWEQGDREIHREEFVHLVDLSHDRVLIAWGAFWFRRDQADGRWNILDDSELQAAVGRRTSHRARRRTVRRRSRRGAGRRWRGRRRGAHRGPVLGLGGRPRAGHGVPLPDPRRRPGVGAGPALGLGAHRVGRLRPRAGQGLRPAVPHLPGPGHRDPARAVRRHGRLRRRDQVGQRVQPPAAPDRGGARRARAAPRRPLRAVAGRQHLPGRAGAGGRRERRGGRRLVLQLLPALPLRHLPGPGVPRDRQPRHDRHRGQRRPGADGGQLPRPRALPQRSRTAPRWGRGCSTASATARTSS